MIHEYEPISFRYESFGAIIQTRVPRALVFVDQDYARSLGYPDSPLWRESGQRPSGPFDRLRAGRLGAGKLRTCLTAPTEVHLALTRRCGAGCRHCYMDSGVENAAGDELGREGIFQALGTLSRMKVFHVAMGGGESTRLPWLFEAAHVARGLGLVPNLTTNGFFITKDNAAQYAIFGQVNVSIDGVGERYATHRGIDGYELAIRALKALKAAGVRVGVNSVISRESFDGLEDIFRLVRRLKLSQLELLRYKPAGRAAQSDEAYERYELDFEQAWAFYPKVMKLARRYRSPLSIDCSFTPYLYAHKPDPKKMSLFGVTGCQGGNLLCGVGADGSCSACSFDKGENRVIGDIEEWWGRRDTFFSFRQWEEAARGPCADCPYLSLCRGGCHVVSRHVLGDVYAPDPGCPIVRSSR